MSNPVYSESSPIFIDHELNAKINMMRSIGDTNQMIKEQKDIPVSSRFDPNFPEIRYPFTKKRKK